MVKRIFGGVSVLILLGLVFIAVSVVRFDKTKEELLPKYTTAASQFIPLSSGAVAHVRDEGNKAGPALVLIHGSNASLQTWEPWVKLLGGKYRVVSMDLPGHGLTGAVPGDDYSRDAMVAFVHEVMQKLAIPRFAIAGNSMGGGVAAEYAEVYPDELTALILVDAAGLPRKPQPGEKIPLGFRLARMPVLNKLMLYVSPRSMFAEGLHKVFVDQSKVTEEMISRYYDLNLYDGNRKATGIRFRTPGNDEAVAEKLGAIKAPTLVMWGDKDPLIPVGTAAEFAKRIPGAKVVVYTDVGHIPMEEVPEKSAADVDAFLTAALAAAAAGTPAQPVETVPTEGAGGKIEVVPASPE
ncbi:MAG TPA: alpha/beta hydrolase [Parvibaculum sp.]